MTTSAGATDKFERLLEAMPRIADAVNSFTSADVQSSAFDALVRALDLPTQRPSEGIAAGTNGLPENDSTEAQAQGQAGDGVAPATPKKRIRGAAPKRNFTIARGLNFAPEGKQSLEEFVSAKQPRTQHENNLVACYYLSEIMGESAVDVGKVLAVYQAAKWSAPAHPDKSLRNTASAEGWIDTANSKDIKVVWAGTNQINKMPLASKENAKG